MGGCPGERVQPFGGTSEGGASRAALDHPRVLPAGLRVVLLILVAYAVAVILPDTLRPASLYQKAYPLVGLAGAVTGDRHKAGHREAPGWYPLGTLGFAADNDGIVTWVDVCGGVRCDRPARKAGMQIGDRIDLRRTAMSDRRAVNEIVFVAHDRPVALRMAMRADGDVPRDVTLVPQPETLKFFNDPSAPEAWTLLLDQVSGLFFILLAAFCVWRHPTREVWGLFLYSIWYNSGQYFVWYANLPAGALRWFDYFQGVFQGAGLAGLLMFALHFPRDTVEGWRRRAEPWLLVPFAALAGLSVWSFRNFTDGAQAEFAYRAYFGLVFAVYAAVFALFIHTYLTLPEARPRIRWIILGALWGLLCFLFAEVYEATSMLEWLPFSVPDWVLQALYAQNVFFPLAAAYAIRRHRVINLRLVINRSVVILASLVIGYLFAAAVEYALHARIGHVVPVVTIGVSAAFSALYEHLRKFEDVVDLAFFRKWRAAERSLKKASERLADGQMVRIEDVDKTLVEMPVDRLKLTSAALFARGEDATFRRVLTTTAWPASFLRELPSGHPALASLRDRPVALPDLCWDGLEPLACAMPVLAVPVVMGGAVSRIALFGPHTSDEALDRDELCIIGRLARSAAVAYLALDAEALRVEYRKLQQELQVLTQQESAA